VLCYGEIMMTSTPLVIVSADCHAGAPIPGYRDYLASRWHDEFDAWAAAFVNPHADLEAVYADRNWDSAKRLRHLEEDGIAAEVIFPNTIPPFYPITGFVAGPPSAADYERRWAGLQAHNRWLLDFCQDAPGQRAGIFQVLFNKPEDTLAEIRWAKQAGLTGGILLPGIPPGSPIAPIWDESYEPIWQLCEELDVPVNSHAGGGVPDYGWTSAMSRVTYLLEITFYTNLNLWHMIWGGVFERHPKLRYVLTEQGLGGILDQLVHHEGMFAVLKGAGDDHGSIAARQLIGDYIDTLPHSPSEYLHRNCYVGASALRPSEAARIPEMGYNRVMWGSDYPHTESTWPDSKESISKAVAGMTVEDARAVLALNAIDFYGFDLKKLQGVAERLGTTEEEILHTA
jgi:predicted TIM-barrel fold metal-dependent hydrolase